MNNFENIIINYFKENSKMTKLSISGNMKHFINDIDINVINYLNDILKNVPEMNKSNLILLWLQLTLYAVLGLTSISL